MCVRALVCVCVCVCLLYCDVPCAAQILNLFFITCEELKLENAELSRERGREGERERERDRESERARERWRESVRE